MPARIGVLNQHLVLHEIADGGDVLVRLLADEHVHGGRIDRHVDLHRLAGRDYEVRTARSRGQRERRAGKRLQLCVCNAAGERIRRRWHHAQPIGSGHHHREPIRAGRKRNLHAGGVGGAGAAHHGRWERGYAIVGEYFAVGWLTGNRVEQRYRDAVHRIAGCAVEDARTRIDSGSCGNAVGLVGRVLIIDRQLCTGRNAQRTVARDGCTASQLQIAREHARARAGFAQPQRLRIAIRRMRGDEHRVGRERIAILVRVGQHDEHRFASAEDVAGQQIDRPRHGDGARAAHGCGRWRERSAVRTLCRGNRLTRGARFACCDCKRTERRARRRDRQQVERQIDARRRTHDDRERIAARCAPTAHTAHLRSTVSSHPTPLTEMRSGAAA